MRSCIIFRAVFLEGRPSTFAQSSHARSNAISGNSHGHPPLWGASPPCRGIFTSSWLVCAPSPLRLSSLPPLFAPMGVVERKLDLSANPQAVQEHTELSGHGHHRPFLGVLTAPRGYFLSVAPEV